MIRRTAICGLIAALTLSAAERDFPPYDRVKGFLPAELHLSDEAKWIAWRQRQDKTIRARLAQGDLDSMVNLLLYGTSFTKQPRIRMENLGEASKSGGLRSRVDDLVAGIREPRENERLLVIQKLLRAQGIDPDDARQAGVFVYNNLLRVAKERRAIAERSAQSKDPASPLDRSSLFDERGLSLDTGIIPGYAIEQTLRDLKQRGLLRDGQVTHVAVVGPGLDFIDKNEDTAFDYYPEQTLQPFALYDSLVRLGLARPNGLALSILDISPRVIDHVERARERAKKNSGYVIQLPRDARPWPVGLIDYWKTLGDQIGTTVAPIQPPEIFRSLGTRAVRVRPEVVRASEPFDLNIILQRLSLTPPARFDLIIATNIFVYYDAFEQALALENVGAMLQPGGLLLTNDRLPEASAGSMKLAGVTTVSLDSPGITAQQAVGWYRKK